MRDLSTPPSTRHLSATVEILPGGSDASGHRCRIYARDGVMDAWTWLEVARRRPETNHTGVASVLSISASQPDMLLVGLSINFDPQISTILSESLCPLSGVVAEAAALIDELTITPLRRFLNRALLRREALRRYWTCPASRTDHHAYPGGLAEHSVEIATAISTCRALPQLERELGITYALLHDYGKIWWMDSELRAPYERRNHEVLGRDMLKADLEWLGHEDLSIGLVMDELLGGPAAPRTTGYPLAVRKIVQAFDQLSCEKTRGVLTATRAIYFPDEPF